MTAAAVSVDRPSTMSGDILQSEAGLTWMEGVLQERLGLPVELSRRRAGELTLLLSGSEGSLCFAQHAQWGLGPIEPPCCEVESRLPAADDRRATRLPAPGLAMAPETLIVTDGPQFTIHYDLLGMAAWILTRCEEIGTPHADEFGRFPAEASHAFRHGYLQRPLVDEWFEWLARVIAMRWPTAVARRPSFAFQLTHDVDEPARYSFRPAARLMPALVADALRGAPPGVLWRGLVRRGARLRQLDPRDPYNTFDWLMRESESRGLRSAFNFICGRTNPIRDADYEIEHPAIRALLRRVAQRGHEIGLHPSFGSYLSPGIIASEARRLRRVCDSENISQNVWGGRMHFLRWAMPVTLLGWEEASMQYDGTLGYAQQPGFRCGTCFEYPAFDPVSARPLALRLRPLVAMDGSVTADCYLGLGYGEEAYKCFAGLRDACRSLGGTFSLLWHNSELVRPEQRALYRAVLDS
jgi:hypothetical protein